MWFKKTVKFCKQRKLFMVLKNMFLLITEFIVCTLKMTSNNKYATKLIFPCFLFLKLVIGIGC